MNNRFGFRDFLVLVLLLAVLVTVVLAMMQYDRQWTRLQQISDKLDGVTQDLRGLREQVRSGPVVIAPAPAPGISPAPAPGATAGPATTSAAATSAATAPTAAATTAPARDDAFARMRRAMAQPGYARGDWYVDAFSGGVAKITPLLSGDYFASIIQGSVQDSLCDRDPDTLDWRGMIARAWQISPDGLTITFQMRHDVLFSDGTPLTADDVVFSYDFVMDPKINAPREKAYYGKIDRVEKLGPYEVAFHFKEPYFESFGLAAGMPILPKHFYGAMTPEDFNQSVGYLLGSGPYRMPDPKAWKPGDPLQLVRNERYWGLAPAFDRLVYKEITNDVARLTAFRNGDVDLFAASPDQYVEMIKDPGITGRASSFAYQSPLGGYRFVAWNEKLQGQPTVFADKRVRQAMTLLLDRPRMIQEIMLGYATLATGPFSPASKQCAPDVQPWPYDAARARALLAEAGCKDSNGDGVLEKPDGQVFKFKLTYPSGNATYEKMVLYMKDCYARAGIMLEPDPLEWAVFTDRLNNKNFEAISLGWTAGIENDIYQMFHSSQMVADGDDFMSYKNEELDRLIEQARRTVDEQERMPRWQACHRILHEDQPYTFLFYAKSLRFVDKRIHNVELTKLGLSSRDEWYVPVGQQKWTR